MTAVQATGKIRFLHIPKTAGSSFDECLFIEYLEAYIRRRRFTFSGNFLADSLHYRQIPSAKRRKIMLYTGHSPLVTGIDEIDCLPTITFLRNPIDRVISHCQHVSEGKSKKMLRDFAHQSMNLDKFLTSGRTQLSNFQTKILLGRESYTLPRGSLDELAARAIDMLEQKLSCFGITEDFDRSLLIFADVLGWKKPPIYRRRNTKDSKSLIKIDARHIDKIRELNLVDLEVYQRARALFNTRVLKYGEELDSDLADFQSKLKDWHAVFPAIDLARYMRRKFAP